MGKKGLKDVFYLYVCLAEKDICISILNHNSFLSNIYLYIYIYIYIYWKFITVYHDDDECYDNVHDIYVIVLMCCDCV